MNIDLETMLVKQFPNLYKNYGGDETKTCMAWGFECGDGWYRLIRDLSEKIAPLGAVAEQVKSKYGTLRFYVSFDEAEHVDEIYDAIGEAEQKSATICEICGEPGTLNDGPWFSTLCEKHAN